MRKDIKDNKNKKIGSIDTQLNGRSTIYNKEGNRIGEIRPDGNRLVAYDKHGKKIAYWQERDDTTYTPNARKIAKGNLLIEMYFQELIINRLGN